MTQIDDFARLDGLQVYLGQQKGILLPYPNKRSDSVLHRV